VIATRERLTGRPGRQLWPDHGAKEQDVAVTLTIPDLIDVAHGATFLGAGGGGTLSSALSMITNGLASGATVSLVTVDEAASAPGVTAACCYVGSQTKGEDVSDPRALGFALDRFAALVQARHGTAVRRLAPVDLGVQGAVVPCLVTAARRGLAVVDADGAGRAVPGLMLTSWALDGPPANPAVAANGEGTATVVIEADTALDCHMIVNGICLANNFGVAAVTMWATVGAALHRALPVTNTISLSRAAGAALRTAAAPVDDVLALIEQSGRFGRIVASGTLTRVDTVQQDYLQAEIATASGTARVLTAGENLIAFGPDGSVIGMSPDALCWVTPDGGTFTNTELTQRVGEPVVVVGIAAQPILRSRQIIDLFKFFLDKVGYNGQYVPLERIQPTEPPAAQ